MKIIKGNEIKNILDKKIIVKMTIAEFLSIYIAQMICLPNEFEDYAHEKFPFLKEINLYLNSIETKEMEDLIDKLKIPHKEWYEK